MFDFHTFIELLKESKEKKETVEKFKKSFPEMLELPLEEQNWFQDYISNFGVVEFSVPEKLTVILIGDYWCNW